MSDDARCPSCGLSPYESGIGDADISRILAERNTLAAEVEQLRELVERAAQIFDDHIDWPQAVSHAELRATAKEFRAILAPGAAE